MPSHAVHILERAHAACGAVACRAGSLAGVANLPYFVVCPEGVGDAHMCDLEVEWSCHVPLSPHIQSGMEL